jgi:hypothetical protein
MFPSNRTPTNSPFRLTRGEPELPPIESAVETKLIGVDSRTAALFFRKLSGSS